MSDTFPAVPGVPSAAGVALNAPPAETIGTVSRMVAEAVAALPPESRGALVGIATTKGGKTDVNLALAVRAGSHVEIVSWLGKSWGEPVAGGVAVQVRF